MARASGVAGLFDGEHGFRVVPEDVGRCRFEQFETFTGLLVAPILWMVGDATRQGFEAMNRALKARAESSVIGASRIIVFFTLPRSCGSCCSPRR